MTRGWSWQTGDQVSTPNLGLLLLGQGSGGADRKLDVLGRLAADEQLYSFLTQVMMASSSSSPPTRIDRATTMPPSEMTATSLVPPPMSTIMLPVGSATGSPAPMAAAMGSSMSVAQRAPLSRRPLPRPASPPRDAGGHADHHSGWPHRFCETRRMKCRSICSVTSKSAITPSFKAARR